MDLLLVNTMVRLSEGSTALTRIKFKKNALSKTYDRESVSAERID